MACLTDSIPVSYTHLDVYKRQLVLPGLVFMLVFDYGPMYGILLAFKDYSPRLGVWGSPWAGLSIGAVYSLDRSLYARLDYARKIKGESYRSEAEDKNGRLWFRLYKLF